MKYSEIDFDAIKIEPISDEEYFSDPYRFGSSSYAKFLRDKTEFIFDFVKYDYFKKKEEKSSALIFGSIMHDMIAERQSLDEFVVGKNQTTNASMYERKELGQDDMEKLAFIKQTFLLDTKKIFEDSEFFEVEKGYKIDIPCGKGMIKLRFKPDLLFTPFLSETPVIIDYKSQAVFSPYGSKDYIAQGTIYALCVFLYLKCDNIRHINWVIEKFGRFKQYTVTHEYRDSQFFRENILNKLIDMTIVSTDPEKYLKQIRYDDVSDPVLQKYLLPRN